MANDRVFLRCKGCGGWKMLLKHFPGILSRRDNAVLEWAERHGACHPHLYSGNLHGDPGFELHTESGIDSGALSPDRQNAEPPER